MKRHSHHNEENWQLRVLLFAINYAIKKYFPEDVYNEIVVLINSRCFKEFIAKRNDILNFKVNPIVKSMNNNYMLEYYSMELDKRFYDNIYSSQCEKYQKNIDMVEQFITSKLYINKISSTYSTTLDLDSNLVDDAKLVIPEIIRCLPSQVEQCYNNEIFNSTTRKFLREFATKISLISNHKQLINYKSHLASENDLSSINSNVYTLDDILIGSNSLNNNNIDPSISKIIDRFDKNPTLVEINIDSIKDSYINEQTPRTSLANFLNSS